jgi:hypothetical protein
MTNPHAKKRSTAPSQVFFVIVLPRPTAYARIASIQ